MCLSVPLAQRSAFVWKYVKHHTRPLTFGVLSMAGRDAVAFTIPLLIREAVNSLAHGTRGTGAHSRWSITQIGLVMIAVAIPMRAFQTLTRLNVMTTSRDVSSMQCDGTCSNTSFGWTHLSGGRARTGDVMASATNDLNAVRMMLGPGLTSLFESVVSLPVAFIVMGMVDWRLTVAALLPAPLAAVLF